MMDPINVILLKDGQDVRISPAGFPQKCADLNNLELLENKIIVFILYIYLNRHY